LREGDPPTPETKLLESGTVDTLRWWRWLLPSKEETKLALVKTSAIKFSSVWKPTTYEQRRRNLSCYARERRRRRRRVIGKELYPQVMANPHVKLRAWNWNRR